MNRIMCPCCKRPALVMSPEIVRDHCGLSPRETTVLAAIWKGRGHPAPADRIFSTMYPSGGPSPTECYSALKTAMSRLRKKLEGTEVKIETVGYRGGWRLVVRSSP